MDALESKYDIAIAGGGPAGTLAAILLARAGYKVALATQPGSRARFEGLSPRVVAVLRAHDLPLTGVGPALPRHVTWDGPGRAQNVEHIVNRGAFDQALRDHAQSEGVGLCYGAIVAVDVPRGEIRMGDGTILRAQLLFEARGRRAPRAAQAQIGPATISLAGLSAAVLPRAGAALSAQPEGWIWQAETSNGPWIQVVGNASALAGPGGKSSKLARFWAQITQGASDLPQNPVVQAIAPRLNAPQMDPRCPRLGDAAVALDPLSGHGLFWALSSALMAVPVAGALLAGQQDLARDFYQARVIETFWRQTRVGRDFYRSAARAGSFWQTRAAWPDDTPAHPEIPAPYLSERVIIRGNRLERAEVVVTASEPGGAAFVHGAPIVPILRRLGGNPLPDFDQFHAQFMPQRPLSAAQAVHGWLIHRGLAQGLPSPSNLEDRDAKPCTQDEAA